MLPQDIMGVVAAFLTPLEAFRCRILIKGIDMPGISDDDLLLERQRSSISTASILDSMWMDLYHLDTDMTRTRSRVIDSVRLPAPAVRRVVASVMRTVDYLSRLTNPVVMLSQNDHVLIDRIRDPFWNPLIEPEAWHRLCGMVARMRRTSLYSKDVRSVGHRCQYILPDLDRQCMIHARPRRLFCGHHRWLGSRDSVFVVPSPPFRYPKN